MQVLRKRTEDSHRSRGTPKVDNAKIELPLTLPITIEQPQQLSLSLSLTIQHQRPLQQSLHVLQLQKQQFQQEQHTIPFPEIPVINMEVVSSNRDQFQHILVSGTPNMDNLKTDLDPSYNHGTTTVAIVVTYHNNLTLATTAAIITCTITTVATTVDNTGRILNFSNKFMKM
ncbi:unnamed protein product [Diabrotica balteata]|uniref:Uncharacterized protein n=1 Tax=Diabrotica balteata TaxID=107213 RepID=A0A9N9SPV3_DIABA|nr:unnamed protein product [Diabrotica balteata]